MLYLLPKTAALVVAIVVCLVASATHAAPAPLPISQWPFSGGIPYSAGYGVTMDSTGNVWVTRETVVSAISASVWNNASWVPAVPITNIYSGGSFLCFIANDNVNTLFVVDSGAHQVLMMNKQLTATATVRSTLSGQGSNPSGIMYYNNQIFIGYIGAYNAKDGAVKIWNWNSTSGTLGSHIRVISGDFWDPYAVHVDDRGIFVADAYSSATAIWWGAHNGTKYTSIPCYLSCNGLTVGGNFLYYTTSGNLIMILAINNATRSLSYYGNFSMTAIGGNRGTSLTMFPNGRMIVADGYNAGSNKLWAFDVDDCVDGSRASCGVSTSSVCQNRPGADRLCGCRHSNSSLYYNCARGRFAGTCNCMCESGYSGSDCSTTDAACIPLKINNTDVVGRSPTANEDNSKFEDNSLYLAFKSPYVSGRTFTGADFEDSTDSRCKLTSSSNPSGSFWTTGAFQSCQDEVKFVMPWTSKKLCGFKVTNTSDNMYSKHSGKALLSYKDVVGTMENTGVTLTRSTDLEFPVHVLFPNSLTVQLQRMNVTTNKANTYVEVALVSEKYDSNTNTLALTLLSSSIYPNKISTNSKFSVTSSNKNVKILSIVVLPASEGGDCNAPGQTCLQKIVITLDIVPDSETRKRAWSYESSCSESFSGDYSLTTVLYACRENSTEDCASANVTIDFTFVSSSYCATVFTMDVPPLSPTMKPYTSADFTRQPSGNFQLGDMAFFSVNANAGVGNTISLSFLDISFNANKGGGEEYMLLNGRYQTHGNASSLKLYNNYFSFYLAGNVFPVGSGVASYTISVKMAVVYQGNKKREIVDLTFDDRSERSARSMRGQDESGILSSTRITVHKKRAVVHKEKQHANAHKTAVAKTSTLANFAIVAVGATLCVLFVVVFITHKKWVASYTQIPATEQQK